MNVGCRNHFSNITNYIARAFSHVIISPTLGVEPANATQAWKHCSCHCPLHTECPIPTGPSLIDNRVPLPPRYNRIVGLVVVVFRCAPLCWRWCSDVLVCGPCTRLFCRYSTFLLKSQHVAQHHPIIPPPKLHQNNDLFHFQMRFPPDP